MARPQSKETQPLGHKTVPSWRDTCHGSLLTTAISGGSNTSIQISHRLRFRIGSVSVSPLVEMDLRRFFSGSQSVVHVVCFVWAMRGPISQ